MQYEVTIGIPVFRAVEYIEKTLESALCQTYQCIEFLVVDDCGGDGSIQLVKKMQLEHPRGKDIRIVCNNKNLGVGASRNRIINEASGNFLFFLDSDDMIEPNSIYRLVSVIKAYNADVVYGSWKRVDKVNDSPSVDYIYQFQKLLKPDSLAMYAFKNYSSFRISVCNCLFDISFLRTEHMNFIDSVFWEDLAFTYEVLTKVKRAILLPDITYYYLCRPGSLSHYQDRKVLQKKEILNNVKTIKYLKDKCNNLIKKPYLPYLCYNLEMNSFYSICFVIRNYFKITPKISLQEMRCFLYHPISILDIFKFRHKVISNLLFWTIGHLPIPLFTISIWLLGKIKRAI